MEQDPYLGLSLSLASVTGDPTDSFYCADGAHALAFDQSGMVHVVFGINWAYVDADGYHTNRPL